MIILDTSILRSISPESSSANLLHAISVAAHESVAMPWMVREELAAQQAIKYQDMHAKAVDALDALRRAAPWAHTPMVGDSNAERHRDYWRRMWTPPLDVIPTSEQALREGVYREANLLPPSRPVKEKIKTGARDTAIWLSAVEYAREHPDEAVYFVSGNTKDFTNGSSPLPYPMDRDIAGMEDRFQILTSIEDLAALFTEATEITAEAAAEALDTAEVQEAIARESLSRLSNIRFLVSIPVDDDGGVMTDSSDEWETYEANLGSVDDIQGYRIGQQEWCTATVVWHLVGTVHSIVGHVFGVVSWATTVLFNLSGDPNLTVVRAKTPTPATADVINEIGVPAADWTAFDNAITQLLPETTTLKAHRLISEEHSRNIRLPLGIPRTYDRALVRHALMRGISRITDDSAPPS